MAALASDLPHAHRNPYAMARALVTYIADPHAVRQAVHDEWGTAPCIYTIKEMRRRHLKPPMPTEPFHPFEGYYPADASRQLERTNTLFVEALERERAKSAEIARANGALHSPYLTDRRLVDRAVEKEIDRARALNGEGVGG